jgi:hypothetical protein
MWRLVLKSLLRCQNIFSVFTAVRIFVQRSLVRRVPNGPPPDRQDGIATRDARKPDEPPTTQGTTQGTGQGIFLYDPKGFVPDVLPDAQLDCEDKKVHSGKTPVCSVMIDGKVAALISRQTVKDNLAGWLDVPRN